MSQTYQQFLTGLSTDELLILQKTKLREAAVRGPSMSRAWSDQRGAEIRLVRAEIKLRGEQLSLDVLYSADRDQRLLGLEAWREPGQ
jgi:hypothetical protein